MTDKKSRVQLASLVILRMSVGWYILYQGLIKYYTPSWSAKGYLAGSEGIFSGIFKALADSSVLGFIDFLNIYGQLAIGAGLILGLFSRVAGFAAILMLSLYYLAHPPFPGLGYSGNYVIINELFIMIVALLVLIVFPTSRQIGLDRFIFDKRKN